MSVLTDICQICLRTDRKFKILDSVLSEYHDQLSDYSLDTIDPRCCGECEHLLRKAYNFRNKCLKAANILQKWIKSGAKKPHPRSLHTFLPPNPLGICVQDDTKIYNYYHEENTAENEEFIGDTVLNVDIKLEKDEEDSTDLPLNNVFNLKTEASTFQEVLLKNDDTVSNVDKIEEIEFEIPYEVGKNENENSGDEAADVLELPDDTSLNSDDDYDFDKEIEQRRRRKRSLAELASVTLTADDVDSDSEPLKKSQKKLSHKDTINETLVREKRIIAKLKNINKDLDSIHEDWERTSYADLPIITLLTNDDATDSKKIVESLTKRKIVDKDDVKVQKSLRRKGIISELEYLSSDLDNIRKNCEKIVNYKEGLFNPKERLKAALVERFASCGELKTESGYVIDKKVIMDCFDRVSDCLMRRLWRFVHGKTTLDAMAIRMLKHIQNKYQNEIQYESVFDIEYLNTKEKVMEEMHEKRKTYECYINAKYKCEKCYLGFKYEGQLDHHINSHEESSGKFICPVCGIWQRTKRSADAHSKSHEAVYRCKLCPLITYYRGSMKNHYHQHLGMQYKCEVCDNTFKSKSALLTHFGRYHREHACKTCGREMTTAALECHQCTNEPRETPNTEGGTGISCSQCQLSFPSRITYLRHCQTTHMTSKRFTGLRKPKGEKPKKKPIFTCRECNAVGSSMGWLMVHFNTEHPSTDMSLVYSDKQTHLCHVCGKGFANAYNMRDHLNLHTGAQPFACDACPKRFHRSFALAQHRLTHLPPAKACSYCGKKFRSQSNLNNHVRGHIGNRCYKCNVCGKGFLHRNALNEHVRGVHHKMRRVRKRGASESGMKSRTMSTDEGSD